MIGIWSSALFLLVLIVMGKASCPFSPVLKLRLTVDTGFDGLIEIVPDDSLTSNDDFTEVYQEGGRVRVPEEFFDPERLWLVTRVRDKAGKQIPVGKEIEQGILAFRGYINIDGKDYFIVGRTSKAW